MKKKVIASIVAVVLALATCITLVACVPNNTTSPESSVVVENKETVSQTERYAMPRAMSFSQKGLDRSATGSVSVNVYATVYPDNAPNRKVDWTVEWADSTNTSNVRDYVNVVPESDGSANAVITCYQKFEGEIIVSVITREGRYTDSCTITFIGIPSELSIFGGGFEQGTGSFGTYEKMAVGTTYDLNLVPTNVFGVVEAERSYTYELKAYGSIETKDCTVNTSTDAKSWVSGSEKTINLADITTVSPWYSSMFDITIQGDIINIKVNCTPENYLLSQTRTSSSKLEYDDKFVEYTNDNWYYELVVTEVNTGISTSIMLRPVQSVTGVSLSMGDYQF